VVSTRSKGTSAKCNDIYGRSRKHERSDQIGNQNRQLALSKRLSNMRKVLLTEPKVGETLQEEPVTKFYDLKEDPQRRMPKEDWTAFSERIAEWQAKRGYPKFPNEPTIQQ
jgi:hypothetical protein